MSPTFYLKHLVHVPVNVTTRALSLFSYWYDLLRTAVCSSSPKGGRMHVRKPPTCSCVRSCRCGWPTPWEKSTCCPTTCWVSPPSGSSRNGEKMFLWLRAKTVRFMTCLCWSWPLAPARFIRYMQSFVELLEFENRKPEDPHTLNEWVNADEPDVWCLHQNSARSAAHTRFGPGSLCTRQTAKNCSAAAKELGFIIELNMSDKNFNWIHGS